MAPAVVEAVAGSAAKDFKNESATARLLGSGKVLLQGKWVDAINSDRVCWYC